MDTLTITAADWATLESEIFGVPHSEGAAFLLCGTSTTSQDRRLLVRSVLPIASADYLVREPLRLSIDSRAYARAAKRAAADGAAVVFVHSHPGGLADFSPQDDREEPQLMRFLHQRLPDKIHGSMVVSGRREAKARIWGKETWEPISRIRVLGDDFSFLEAADAGAPREWFDRQVAAFGPGLQRLLGALHVGIVGAGGTGSAVAEQLYRLGVGRFSLYDGDKLESSNVTRVYGSAISRVGHNKADILRAHLQAIGFDAIVHATPQYIDVEDVAKELRACDIVFGCTDLEGPRALLVQLSLRYLIPVFDLGVKISSTDGALQDVTGRVTTLFPGNACLFCRGRISAERIALEQKTPEERRRLAAEGYAPELAGRDPAVIPFTTAIAAQAVMELIHRLTGFMGKDRRSTEVLPQYNAGRLGKNGLKPTAGCLCQQRALWGRGDTRDFLGVTWHRSEK